MDDLLIKNYFSEKEKEDIVNKIYSTLKEEKYLSQRSIKELDNLIEKKEIYCLYKKNEFIGFIFKSKLSNRIIEVHGMYIKPKFRQLGYSDFLMKKITGNKDFKYLGVTFNHMVGEKLISWGFEKYSLKSLSLIEKINFLKHRLNVCRLIGIKNHFKEKKQLLIFIK